MSHISILEFKRLVSNSRAEFGSDFCYLSETESCLSERVPSYALFAASLPCS